MSPARLYSRIALRVSLIYVAFAASWILLSDHLLQWLLPDAAEITQLQTLKGGAFVLITGALLYQLISRYHPEKLPRQSSGKSLNAFFPLVVFAVLGGAIAGSGWFAYVTMRDQIRHEIQQNLINVAALKGSQIEIWLAERKTGLELIAENSSVAAALADVARSKDPVPARFIAKRLDEYSQAYGFTSYVVYDARSRLIYASTRSDAGEHMLEAGRAMAERRTIIVDFHRHQADENVYIGFISPLIVDGRVQGALYASINAGNYFYPYLKSWPGESQTAETTLFRRDGDHVLYLSPLRFRSDAPLTLRLPMSDRKLAAAQGAAGARGLLSNVHDYRQGPLVLDYITEISGTPWLLSAEFDESEAYGSLNRLGLVMSVVTCVLIIFSAWGTWLWWKRQQSSFALVQENDALARQALALQYDALSKYANDIILITDEQGHLIQVNERALEVYGYTKDELIGKTVYELRTPAAILLPNLHEKVDLGETSLLYESEHVRKDGTTFPVEVSARLIESEGQSFCHMVLRDITNRKQSEQQILRLNKMYAALSQTNETIVKLGEQENDGTQEQQLYSAVCRIAVEMGGMALAWVGVVDESTALVKRVAQYGSHQEYLDGLEISVNPELSSGTGPTGVCLRENRLVIVNDFIHDPLTANWHQLAENSGLGASVSYPLPRNGKPYAAFMAYHEHAGAFDEEIIRLLDEMAKDILFARETLEIKAERQLAEARVRENEERFRSIFESVNDAVFLHDAHNGKILDANERACEMYGYSHEELLEAGAGGLSAGVAPYRARDALRHLHRATQHHTESFEWRARHQTGRLFWVAVSIRPVTIGGRSFQLVTVTDIDQRKQNELSLQLDAEVFHHSHEGVVITDGETRILTVNRAFCQITGYTQDEVQGQTPRLLKSDRHPVEFYRDMWKSINESGYWQGEVWNRRKDGSLYPEWLSISRVLDGAGSVGHYIGVFSDITQRIEAEQHIQRLAHFDALTGLPNRSLLDDRASQAISMAERKKELLAVMFLDLDHFKNINDTLGHRVGDELLIALGKRLTQLIRDEDTVSRLGGDEFILVLPSTDEQGAAHVAQKVMQAVAEPYQIDQHELLISSSIGIAMYPVDALDFDNLSKCADTAMYRAKNLGRNTFCFFTAEMQAHAERVQSLENALRYALMRNELHLNYQPQVSLATGKVIGVEALVRWQHPELGLIPPSDFIPIAEDNGSILEIGEWVLREAIGQVSRWHSAGLPLMPVAVNLSAVQFRSQHLPALVLQVLRDSQVAPEYLELELTESLAMGDPKAVIAMMQELKERGVRMSIDDFGTGYSSFNYLRQLPVYKLKIDQSFVRDLGQNSEGEAIVRAIVALSKNLHFKTIAEGVETREQMELLREYGCDEIQGYYYSKPLPPDQMQVLLTQRGMIMDVSGELAP